MSIKGTVLLTGANGGLGLAVVRKIVSRPELAAYHGLYAVRDSSSSHRLRYVLGDAAVGPHCDKEGLWLGYKISDLANN